MRETVVENSSAQPSQVELDDMARRAQEVVSLLAHIRRLARDGSGALPSPAPEELAFLSASGPSRGPKRSWGEIAGEEDEEAFSPTATRKNSGPVYQGGGDRGAKDERGWEGDGGDQLTGEPGGSAAEKDMALIRRKRASQQAPSNTPKGKYRKRSVSESFSRFVFLICCCLYLGGKREGALRGRSFLSGEMIKES